MRLLILALFLTCHAAAFGQLNVAANDNEGMRVLRYKPNNGGFVTVNGDARFTRALYGTNTAFRIETSDVPEFGFFMPNMGGNLQFGLMRKNESIWLNKAKHIKSTYYPGTRIYEIKDPFVGEGVISLKVLAMSNADGAVMQFSSSNLPQGTALLCMYGGASNMRFSRNGDLGVDKPDCFDLHIDACKGNIYTIDKNSFVLHYGQNTKQPRSIEGIFPENTELKTGSPFNLGSPEEVWQSNAPNDKPILLAKIDLDNDKNNYLAFQLKGENSFQEKELKTIFDKAEQKRMEIANTVQIETPDEYLNPLGGVLSVAADAIWDNCWLHGAIGWRMPLNGWRAAYTGDCLGWHDRARVHFDNYAASQVTEVPPVIPHPAQDTAQHCARAAKIWGTQMYSNGYICRNPNQNTKMHHYDMNQCYIDELLWHLNWTGDWEYAPKIWPVIERHLQWEKRNYDPNNDGLYDAYASIWASDALYYNSGAVTHASAYNYRANKLAACIASKIGVDPRLYEHQAEKILKAINDHLWLSDKGHWAEYIDFMGAGNVHPAAAIWTVYHAIDSDIADIFQAYQATRYVDNQIPHIPVKAMGLEDEGYETLSTTNWFPYSWSINNVAFAEVAHMALAYWQSGRYDEAYKLFKSSVLDGMYLGSSPGNIGQISYYDKARGECYRDFGDPVGMYSRAIIQGLYGVRPDLLNNRLVIRPGFPSAWEYASLKTSDISFQFDKDENSSTYKISKHLKQNVDIDFRINAESSHIKALLLNGSPHEWNLIENIGSPLVQVICNNSDSVELKIIWRGSAFEKADYQNTGVCFNKWVLKSKHRISRVYDPQNILPNYHLTNNVISGELHGAAGHHTFFVQLEQGQMTWWEAVDIEIKEPFEIECFSEDDNLKLKVKNNQNVPFVGEVLVNKNFSKALKLAGGETSSWIAIPLNNSVFGTNTIQVLNAGGGTGYESHVTNWNIINQDAEYEMLSLNSCFNASVSDIFEQEYLTPRSPYTTLQIPIQGIGEWCHPLLTVNIDDAGLRCAAKDDVLFAPFKIPFRTVGDTSENNIAFTTLWDNFPDKIEIPLAGNARHAYLLMAGSTNHMQCHITNGKVTVSYADGSVDSLNLVNPENWLPIEQDLYTDHYAFSLKRPAPYRVALKSGIVSRNLGKDLGIDQDEVYGREIDGGAGIVVDLPLDASKKLKSLSVECLANDVVVGLMSLTLMR